MAVLIDVVPYTDQALQVCCAPGTRCFAITINGTQLFYPVGEDFGQSIDVGNISADVTGDTIAGGRFRIRIAFGGMAWSCIAS